DERDEPVERERSVERGEPDDPLAPRGIPLGGPLRAVGRGAALLVMAAALTHMGLLVLYLSPDLPQAKARSAQVDAWLRPLFPQDWNIFAPDPPRTNTHLEVRSWRGGRPGPWIDLTAHDIADHRGNPLPSREDQTVLRKAVSAHLTGSPHTQLRAPLTRAAQYLRNAVVVRLEDLGEPCPDAVELRLRTVPIAPPGQPGQSEQPARQQPLGTWEVLP
ncbi:DUF5819 family protein, partial [Streptomyces sp. T-3]|nr:DUF5819 family protein [Streptomyces sp. T-3]